MRDTFKKLRCWLHPVNDWRALVLQTVEELTTVDHDKSIDEIHADLVDSGVSADHATKLVLFIPSAFAKEMFAPEGIKFPDHYLRLDADGSSRRLQYNREPIFLTACEIAQEFINAQRFGEINVVILWSAEGKLVQDSISKGTRLSGIMEITHHF